MSIIPVIDNEYLYKLKLFYRKTIPSNDIFYLVFFLVKFFPILLFTHAVDFNNDKNQFTLSKIIKASLLFNHSVTISYVSLCCVVYVILLLLLLSFLYVFLYFYFKAKTTDYQLYGIPSNKIEISKRVKYIFKFTCYLYLFVVFIYQHIIEILYYGVFKIIFLHVDHSHINEANIILEYKYPYLIFTINIIFILLLFILMYSFFLLTSAQTITTTYGFNYTFSTLSSIFDLIFFSVQGAYTTSIYFSDSFRKEYLQIGCYVIVVLLAVKILNNFKTVNYLGCGILLRFINYINNFCLVSGITEILIYHLSPSSYKTDQVYYFVTLFFDLLNAWLLAIIIEKIHKAISLRNLAMNIFVSNRLFQIESLFGFFWELKKMGKEQNRFLVILDLFDRHQDQCNDEKCVCHKYMKYLSQMHNKDKIEKLIYKFFYIGESKITELISNRSNITLIPLQKLLFLHCDFLYSLKGNIPVTLYLCQYYLIKMRKFLNFHYAYMIYEINYLTLRTMKRKDKSDKKAKGFLKENLLLDKIMKIIYILCTNIERLLHMKNLKNSNSKLLYTCEDILNPLIEYVEKNKTLIGFIISFTKKHRFELSIEVKFLLYYYSKLFNTMLPSSTMKVIYNASNPIPSYDEFEKINFEKFISKKNALILFLTQENKFIIRYTSTELNDILLYKRHELLGTDFNEIMIPKDIAPYHTIYMKEFILMGNKGYAKTSFLLNKYNQLIPVNIICEVQPTLSSLYTFIVNVEISQSNFYNNYYIVSDVGYNLWSISESFEKHFYFSVKMLNSLKINYCDFFGVGRDKINDYFKNIKLTNTNYKKKQINAFTSVKPEEMYFYDTMDVNWLKSDKQKAIDFNSVKLVIVSKDRFISNLIKLGKNIEELGLETEWKWKINLLYKKLKYSEEAKNEENNSLLIPQSTAHCAKTITSQAFSKINTDVFFIKFHLKLIGQLQYYVSTISEVRDEIASLFDNNINNIILNSPTEKDAVDMLNGTFSKEVNFQNFQSFLSRDEKGFLLSPSKMESQSSIGGILKILPTYDLPSGIIKDGSSMSMNSTLQGLNPKGASTNNLKLLDQSMQMYQIPKDNIVAIKARMDKLIKDSTELQVYKFLEILFLFGVFMLNIGNFIYNQTSLTFSLNLFNINAYSFLLTNDIFYGSMASLNLCLLRDGVQRGDVENLSNKIKQSAKDLMNHYQLLYGYMNIMIDEDQIRRIYSLFNIERDYSRILANWEEQTQTSSLIGEIYSFHYWLKTFNAENSTDNYCRIQRFFFSNQFNLIKGQTDELATKEKKLIYYICSNIVSHISEQLENLTKIANEILKKENKNAKNGSFAINLSILIVGIILYFLVFFNLRSSRVLFRGKMVYLFTKHENEESFFEDIKRFKMLLDCFSKKECNDYTVFKTGITDCKNIDGGFYMNSTSLLPTITKGNANGPPSARKTSKKKKLNGMKNKLRIEKEKQTKKEIEEKLEEMENKLAMTNKQFSNLATPRYAKYSLFILTVTFLVFFGTEICGIVLSTKKYDGLMTENEFATNFLNRGPKLNELVLYSIISVILNDPNYIKKDPTKYKDNVLANHYNIDFNLNSNSLFQALGESNYAYLYYQINIIRSNINQFINSKEMSKYLPTTSENESLFDDGVNFCVYVTYQYIQHYYSGEVDEDEFLQIMSDEAKQCRTVGNGMNLNGYNAGMDLMLLLLQNLYYTFKNEEDNPEERQMMFLQSDDIKIIEENLLNVIRSLQFADSFLVIEDINNSYHSIHQLKIFFSIASIILSCVVMFGILVTVINKLDYYNEVCTEIVNMFDKALKNYCSGLIEAKKLDV